MSTMVAVVAWPLLVWWLVSPFLALAIGARRRRPLAGWLCALVPLVGPFLAARLPRPDRKARRDRAGAAPEAIEARKAPLYPINASKYPAIEEKK